MLICSCMGKIALVVKKHNAAVLNSSEVTKPERYTVLTKRENGHFLRTCWKKSIVQKVSVKYRPETRLITTTLPRNSSMTFRNEEINCHTKLSEFNSELKKGLTTALNGLSAMTCKFTTEANEGVATFPYRKIDCSNPTLQKRFEKKPKGGNNFRTVQNLI